MKDVKALKLMTLNDVLSQINGDMTLGIGTGSTMELLLPQMAQLIKNVVTILQVYVRQIKLHFSKELGIKICEINDVDHIDLAIDGADEVDPPLNIIKGGGGALFREKVIDEMASRFVVVVDETKMVQYLGETFKLPVEVDKFNWYHILRKIESYADIKVERRVNEDVAFITDNGNYILDCKLPKGIDPYKFHEYLIHLTGVFETGYFLDMADQVIVGTQEGVKILEK